MSVTSQSYLLNHFTSPAPLYRLTGLNTEFIIQLASFNDKRRFIFRITRREALPIYSISHIRIHQGCGSYIWEFLANDNKSRNKKMQKEVERASNQRLPMFLLHLFISKYTNFIKSNEKVGLLRADSAPLIQTFRIHFIYSNQNLILWSSGSTGLQHELQWTLIVPHLSFLISSHYSPADSPIKE